MHEVNSIVSSAPELWRKIVDSAGLQLAPKINDIRAYDDDILKEIRGKLFESKVGDFEELLVAGNVTVEQLLTAFFNATAPFSRMLTRILQLYERAAASHNSTSIDISIQLNAMGSKFEFDLKSFARQVKLVEYAIITQNLRRWSRKTMWDMADLFPREDWRSKEQVITSDGVGAWITSYEKGDHNFPALPQFRRTGISWIDELLSKLEFDLNGFLTKARELFGNYSAIRFVAVLPPDGDDAWWRASDVREPAHDFWPLPVVTAVQITLDRIRRDPSSPVELGKLQRVQSFIDNLQLARVTREDRIEKLLEILRLPVWKRREAMYAVWVCASVLLDLDFCKIDFNVKNGRLEFPFRATKIATLSQPEQPKRRVEFWSELRTPASHLIGKRKSSIQPDYRFRVIDGRKATVDVLLIECKQYKRSSLSNFTSAIVDYAVACPSAKVFLCNYGPVTDSVINRVLNIAPKLANQIDAKGFIRPEGAGEFRLRRAVRDALAPSISSPDGVGWPVKGDLKIELNWFSQGTDLDLHLKQGQRWTNYKNPEGVLGSKYLEDQRGESRVSTEVVTLKMSGDAPYSIFVHRYAGPATLQQARAEVLILGFDLSVDAFFTVPKGNGDWWHVADIRPGFSSPIKVNRILAELPADLENSPA